VLMLLLEFEGIDMINMLKLGFVPKTCCWVHASGQAQSLLAMSVPSSLSLFIIESS
jgi:peptidylprolyl isomerase domain and WD repeat-containing protein 1